MSQQGDPYSEVLESEADVRLGMTKLIAEKDRQKFNQLLEQYTRAFWVHGRKYERRVQQETE